MTTADRIMVHDQEFTSRDRAQYFAVIALGSLTLMVARMLKPAAAGLGTHEQLGLPACIFHRLTGIPCPSCGLTTSFSHFAHFEFAASFLTQPFGFVLCAATAFSIPFFLIMVGRRVRWESLISSRSSRVLTYAGLAMMLGGWIYKIIITH
jgi:hypothetical protein